MTGANQLQNLINPVLVPLPSADGSRIKFYKALTLDVLGVLAAFSFGYFYRGYIAIGGAPWFVIGALLVFGMVSALQVFICANTPRRAMLILCEVAALSLSFYSVDWHFLSAAAACAFVLLFLGYLRSRSELDRVMDIRPFRITKGVMSNMMTGALMFMIVIYVPLWEQSHAFISQKDFNAFFDWTAGSLSVVYPKMQIFGSLDNFAKNIVRSQLAGVAAFQSMNLQSQSMVIEQNAASLIDNLSKTTGMVIQPSESMSVVVYRFIAATLAGWKDRFQKAFFIGWGIALFFIARSAGIIFVWIDQFIFLFVYEILLAARFIRIKEEARSKEVIEY